MKYIFLSFFTLSLFCIVANVSKCGGNCPGDCDQCLCGIEKSRADVKEWCAKYHWNQRNCECVVMNESEGNRNAVNQNIGSSYDVGLWQINSVNWDSCNGGKTPCDTEDNLRCAIDIYRWGRSIKCCGDEDP